MSFRKIFPLVFLFFAGAILGRPLVLGSLGLAVKTVLYFDRGWNFQYSSIDWLKGKVFFTDAKIVQNKIFSLDSPSMSVDFSKKHLEFDRPRISLLKIPESSEDSDWTLSMNRGTIEGLGFKKAQFCFEKLLPSEVGRLTVEWGGSQAILQGIKQGGELWLETELKNFDASLIEAKKGSQGIVNGSCHLVFESNQWKRGSAHLSLENFSYGDFCSGLHGTMDWEGDGLSSVAASFSELKKICESREERVRLVLTKGSFHGPLARIDQLKGDLSFKSGLGMKWEFQGEVFCSGAPDSAAFCNWSGRAFLHEERPHWIESDFHLADSIVRIRGEELFEKIIWEAEWEKIGALELAVIQPFVSSISSAATQWEILAGRLSGKGQAAVPAEGECSWNFSYYAHDFSFRRQQMRAGFKNSQGEFSSDNSGRFSVDGGALSLLVSEDKNRQAEEWSGKGEIVAGSLVDSYFEGRIGNEAAFFVARGSLDRFSAEAKTETAQFSIEGGAVETGLELAIRKAEVDGICFSGTAQVDDQFLFSLHVDQFKGPVGPFLNRLGWDIPIEGVMASAGFGLYVSGSISHIDWSCQTKGSFQYASQDQTFSFYCPCLEKKGEDLFFDFRVEGAVWDLMRLSGRSKGFTAFSLDRARSHFLGEPLAAEALFDDLGVNLFSLEVDLASRSLPLAASLFKNKEPFFFLNPLSGAGLFSFDYKRESGSRLALIGKDLCWQGAPIDLDIAAEGKGFDWEILRCQMRDLSLLGKVGLEGDVFRVYEGELSSARGIKACFEGHIDSSWQSQFHLSQIFVDLRFLNDLTRYLDIPFAGLEGNLEGDGCIAWKEKLEADFDFTASRLKMGDFEWENRGPLHFYYSSTEGVSFSGIDFCWLKAKGEELPDFNCRVELFGYDPLCSLWFLNGAHVHLAVGFLEKLPELNRRLYGFNADQDIDFFADFSGSRNFSKIDCCMKEGFIPLGGSIRHLEDLTFCFFEQQLWAECRYVHQGCPLKFHLDVDLDPAISGKLTFESIEDPISEDLLPLTVYWTHTLENGLSIKEIEGAFAGLEASFHAINQESSLIGSARLDCSRFSKIVPPEIAELFTDLKMGKGYELKGRLSFHDGAPSFSGLLSGKQFDLFGYQLRTLLGRIDLAADRVSIADLKISDSAAILKVDEIVAETVALKPWTISIPHLTILELRPSLLHKSGESPGSISPLVVRELRIEGFKGLLDDSNTYTAQGELSFINSYRREHTVFDIPADLLGRIVGLDLELLIPACGSLSYEIREGKFFLKELKNAYSEGKRSEFFLVPADPVPCMDFDGRLQVLVKCKQFVLFKFMESFMISIEGELNDPKFHLQKKRRFWNL